MGVGSSNPTPVARVTSWKVTVKVPAVDVEAERRTMAEARSNVETRGIAPPKLYGAAQMFS